MAKRTNSGTERIVRPLFSGDDACWAPAAIAPAAAACRLLLLLILGATEHRSERELFKAGLSA